MKQVETALEQVLSQGHWRETITKFHQSGREVIVDSRWILMRDADQQPQSILVVDTDITEKKQLEAQLLRAQRLESIGTLAGGIAHNLNNILTPMVMASQLLSRNNLDKKSRKLLEILATNARRGSDMVMQILAFARGTEGKQLPGQLAPLLGEIVTLIRQTFPASIEIQTQISPTLGMVLADLTQLHQLLVNLCVNARDAMSDGGLLIVRAENFWVDQTYAQMHLDAKVGAYVVLTIEDAGIGMTPEVLEQIFDPFFTTKAGGTGLGVSTVLRIVKNHGGFVSVSSQVGQGCQFKVFLPVISANPIPEPLGQVLPRGEGELVLIVDDEEQIREVTQATLEAYNYRIIQASDGVEAVACYVQHQTEIRVVLMDVMLPNLDGSVAAQALRKLNPEVPVILTSGVPLNAEVSQVAQTHAFHFLPKPFTAPELLQLIDQLRTSWIQ
jgi:signal transduction histidine kinase/ActR/RegA family two-component response regulator